MIKFEARPGKKKCSRQKVIEIQKSAGLLYPVAEMLCRRGIDTPELAKSFLHPAKEHLHDPFLLPDMQKTVQRIKKAIEQREKITVFCDYDADGISGGCALYLHLLDMGAIVDIMAPNRHKEGYGLNENAVEQIAANGATLIITVDCGITNVGETKLAKSLDIDIIITDHHECADTLPDTPYIVNPKRADSEYPCSYIAGCGVAFKLIHALSGLLSALKYIDLAAIGTITDIVPLLGENRVIAYLGIKKMRKNPSAGIAALANEAGINLSSVNSFNVSFGLGPRINAAGRVGTAGIAIDILKATKSEPELFRNAQILCELNGQRKKEVEVIIIGAEKRINENEYMKDRAIILADKEWNTGVIGIAAAKIAEKYCRPCVLFGENQGKLVGSARSIDGINMYEALGVFSDRYEKFGGHAQAAGLTIKPEILDELRRNVCDYLNQNYDESVFVSKKVYDMKLFVKDITKKLVKDIERLEPFGHSNERPYFAVQDADITETRFVGKDNKPHLKFMMSQQGETIEAISFFFKESHAYISRKCDFLCEAGINDFNGNVQLVVRDTLLKYDRRLKESFFKANQKDMAKSFISEVTAFKKNRDKKFLSEEEFVQLIESEIAASRFGLCIVAKTIPAIKRLLKNDIINNALRQGNLSFCDKKNYSADNCIAHERTVGHDRVYYAGLNKKSVFFDEKLMEDYRQHAKTFFAEREELLGYYQKIVSFTAKKAKEANAISQYLEIPCEKTAFVLQVFRELMLIDVDKSGRIHALQNTGQKKQLRQSICYAGFEDIINKK